MQHMYIATYPVGNSPKISTLYLLSNLISVDISVATIIYGSRGSYNSVI